MAGSTKDVNRGKYVYRQPDRFRTRRKLTSALIEPPVAPSEFRISMVKPVRRPAFPLSSM